MTDATQTRRLHPLIALAAASLILLSGIGIAKMMNWLPTSSAEAQEATEADKLAADGKAAEAKAVEEKAAKADEEKAAAKTASNKSASSSSSSGKAAVCSSCGVVTAVTPISHAAKPSGVGAVAGAIVGGVLGHQVGGGDGKKVATVAGALGGAYAGNAIEGKTRSTTSYRVSVRFEDGHHDSYSYAQEPGMSVGDQVRAEGGELVRR